MITNQSNPWFRVTFSLGIAVLLVCISLVTLPTAAAQQFPNCNGSGTPPTSPVSGQVFTVTGVISDEDGTPIECVEVFAFSGAAQAYTYTHSSGQYTLTLEAGIYDFVFHPPLTSGLASQARRWIRESQVLNITLPPGYIISGTVYSDVTKTQPVSHVNVFASNPSTFVGLGAYPTGPTGTYQIALEEGGWELTFTPPHFLGLGPTRTEVITLPPAITQDIILPSGFTIHGRVTTSTGGGQANVEIFAQDFSQDSGYGITATDADGYYTGTVPSGTFDILFFAPPFQKLGSTVVTDVTGVFSVEHNVTLPAGHTVSGTVRCGEGLANTFVLAKPQPPLSAGHFDGWGRFTGADGFYALALQAGTYTISVEPPKDGPPNLIVPTVEVTQDLTLDFDYCLSNVAISGPQVGIVNTPYTFIATANPTTVMLLPITYTWQATEQSEVTTTISALSHTVSFTWDTVGTKAITITVENAKSAITNTHIITINLDSVYLPIIVKS